MNINIPFAVFLTLWALLATFMWALAAQTSRMRKSLLKSASSLLTKVSADYQALIADMMLRIDGLIAKGAPDTLDTVVRRAVGFNGVTESGYKVGDIVNVYKADSAERVVKGVVAHIEIAPADGKTVTLLRILSAGGGDYLVLDDPTVNIEVSPGSIMFPVEGFERPKAHIHMSVDVMDPDGHKLKTQDEQMEHFGSLVKRLRLGRELGLREFCFQVRIDPSNFSKMERGKIDPPEPDSTTFRLICDALDVNASSEEAKELARLASVGRGRIPEGVLGKEQIAGMLPAFFRTLDGGPISDEERQELIRVIQEA